MTERYTLLSELGRGPDLGRRAAAQCSSTGTICTGVAVDLAVQLLKIRASGTSRGDRTQHKSRRTMWLVDLDTRRQER